MELASLIADLSRTSAYPGPVASVEVRQTHISVVFLAGDRAYKIKKPVNLGFLDFRRLSRRRHFCEEEVRLNRRLAPGIYLGVAPVVQTPEGLMVGAAGEPIEWAVVMKRLPEEATLRERLARDAVTPDDLDRLARRLATFHAQADRSPRIASFGRLNTVIRNLRENLVAARAQVGETLTSEVCRRLIARTTERVKTLSTLISQRAARGVACDTHGDLRLDHVYMFPDQPEPDDLVIVDCVEFNERFRYADPVADAAFLAMDLAARGRRDLADAFRDAFLRVAHDEAEGRMLWPFYVSYRSAVRAKVAGLQAREPEVSEADRDAARRRARAHWLLALEVLETSARRPALLLIGGLPGSGKSTLARSLADRAGFQLIRSDAVRKELAGIGTRQAPAGYREGLYSPEWTERTYEACLDRARSCLAEGGRAIVDASFLDDRHRRRFLEAADQLGLPSLFLEVTAPPETIRRRLEARAGDLSDADWSTFQNAAPRWSSPGTHTAQRRRALDTNRPPEIVLDDALAILHDQGISGEGK